MGSGASNNESSREKLEEEVNLMTPHLPVAEFLNGGIIRLTGFLNFFNPDSLLEPSWLKGKLTLDDYRAAIKYINTCAIRSQVDDRNLVRSLTISKREQAKAEACTAAVTELNRRYGSVRFTYQQGIKNVSFHTIWSSSWNIHITPLSDGSARKGPESYIYINVN
ncbi:unnamed protein product [Rotaria sp. Silwood2]|nr:unnamed protein product [Rotaria sp. Silwood2]CAF3096217.1 unnamed protein product [Rotaria sp. Silwood2]CAF3137232.1 unnamed protein product [Rotaria sp. Silwood2]CAF3160095.1 unnamed protein product [Rotaria sp. Silwood2]CAF3942652.1 unnamed protein product [Rotaria sp. Silwood2]